MDLAADRLGWQITWGSRVTAANGIAFGLSVQLSDWGEPVPAAQVDAILDHGTRRPATGVMVFHWGSLKKQTDKVDEMTHFYRAIRPQP